MYGVALPIMFPIAAFTYFKLLCCGQGFNNLLLLETNQFMAISSTIFALSTMKISPILLLFFGYWAMGNT